MSKSRQKITLSQSRDIPFNRLLLSKANVRRTIEELAEDIARRTLLQSLTFLALREKGISEEEIAAAFFVSVQVVKQRLKLASVSPKLLDVYAEDGMTLDQLMAFTVSLDHERQEQMWEALQRSYTKEPYYIRRLLTEGAVRASDKGHSSSGSRPTNLPTVQSCGISSSRTMAVGCRTLWLLDRLVAEKLEREAEAVRAEGWKRVKVATDFPYGHTYSCATSPASRSR
jgi:ParB family chromosome partitioning protein